MNLGILFDRGSDLEASIDEWINNIELYPGAINETPCSDSQLRFVMLSDADENISSILNVDLAQLDTGFKVAITQNQKIYPSYKYIANPSEKLELIRLQSLLSYWTREHISRSEFSWEETQVTNKIQSVRRRYFTLKYNRYPVYYAPNVENMLREILIKKEAAIGITEPIANLVLSSWTLIHSFIAPEWWSYGSVIDALQEIFQQHPELEQRYLLHLSESGNRWYLFERPNQEPLTDYDTDFYSSPGPIDLIKTLLESKYQQCIFPRNTPEKVILAKNLRSDLSGRYRYRGDLDLDPEMALGETYSLSWTSIGSGSLPQGLGRNSWIRENCWYTGRSSTTHFETIYYPDYVTVLSALQGSMEKIELSSTAPWEREIDIHSYQWLKERTNTL